jgi:alpha/beta superfamily hydrolase
MSDLGAASRELKIHADGFALEARLNRGRGLAGAVVAPPHPLYGGSMTNPVVQVSIEAMLESGLATLAFNYRGTERSEGVATSSLEASTADYRAALEALRAEVPGPTIASGYSFGAGTALLSVRDEPALLGLLLIAPPLGMLRAEDLAACAARILIIVGDDDEYAPISELRSVIPHAPTVELEVLPGVDHFFHFGGLPLLYELVRDRVQNWLK